MSTRKTLDGKMPETYGFEIQVVCGRRDMVYKSTRGTESFYSCVKAGVDQAKTREVEDGKQASKVEKLRDELEKAQQELDAIAEAAENAGENQQDHLRASADKQRARVS